MAATLLAASVGVESCGSPQVGSRTHWLLECDEDTECGGPLSCLCGVCTIVCDSTDDCEEGACASLTAASARCQAHSPGRMCLDEQEADCETPLVGTGALGGAGGQGGADADSDCGGPEVLVCETFDSPELPEHYKFNVSEEGELSHQTCVVAEGDGAASSRGSWGAIQIPVPGPLESGPVHARIRAYWPSGSSDAFNAALLTLRPTTGFIRGQLSVRLDETGALRLDGSPEFGDFVTESGVVAPDRWVCIEIAGELPSAGATFTLSVDGEPLITRSDTPADSLAEPFSVAMLFHADDGASQAELVLDDFALSREPIGCD